MAHGKADFTWTIRIMAVLALSITASGCAPEDGGSVASGRKGMEMTSEPKLPQETETIRGVAVQLTAERRTWDAGETPLFCARVIVDEEAGDDVFLATDVGLGCRVRVEGQDYKYPQSTITGILYQSIRKVSMELNVRLDESWRSMDGGEALSLSKGSHTVQFAWAGYKGSKAKQQPLLLLSNEVEIVVNGK